MAETSADRDPLDRLAEEFVSRYRAGERPSLAEYEAKLPDRADEVRDLFPALIEMEQLKPVSLDEVEARPISSADPERVGEFRILRRIGVGGMGVVYEAIQESLGRHVALKMLPTEQIHDPKRLERFRREARAAARLHHTNIVPVFGVGEADGRHYYAMQFISGHPLDAVIAEVRRLKDPAGNREMPSKAVSEIAGALFRGTFTGPPLPDAEPLAGNLTMTHHPAAVPGTRTITHHPATAPVPPIPSESDNRSPDAALSASDTLSSGGKNYWNTVAKICAQVADALAYAHSQGVLHRDIKPANLLLDLHGTVWVADFGLAKSTEADDLTHTGDIIGTLRYMAPERFDGVGDQRADIYALGLTLYELLALTPAYSANNRQKLVEQVLAAHPMRPRSLNAQIPRDLETIVLKAIQRDPTMRYSTASELAEDLRRFTQDRPIRARRASLTEQVWRWCRRNPAVAGLLSAVLLLLTVIAIGGVVVSLRLDKSVKDVGIALKQAETDRDKALEAEQARDAEKAKNAGVWQALIDDAKITVNSGRVGQRLKTLELIRKAAAILTKPELHDIAARALTLPDFELMMEWDGWKPDTGRITFDDSFHKFVRLDNMGGIEVGRVVPNGEEILNRIPGTNEVQIHGCWLSPNGRYLAFIRFTAAPERRFDFCVRDLESMNSDLLVLEEMNGDGLGIGFHPNSTEVAVSIYPQTVCRFSLQDGKQLSRWQLPDSNQHPSYDPSGTKLAITQHTRIQIVDVKSGEVIWRTPLPGLAHYATWSPDGRIVLVNRRHGPIHVLDARTGQEVLKPCEVSAMSCRYVSESNCVLSSDGTLIDTLSGRRVLTLSENLACDSPTPSSSRTCVTRVGQKLRLWRLHPGDELRTLTRRGAASGEQIMTPGTESTGRLLSTSIAFDSGLFTFFDLVTGDQVASGMMSEKVQGYPNHATPNRGWSLVSESGFYDWPVSWPTANGESVKIGPLQKVLNFQQASMALGTGVSRDGNVIAVPNVDHTLIYHRDRPNAPLKTEPQKRFVQNASVSPDGSVVVTACHADEGPGPSIRVWDTKTAKLIKDLTAEPNGGLTARFSRDGSWLALHYPDRWDIYNAKTWEKVHQTRGGESLTFTHDGKLFALDVPENNGIIQLYETATGRVVAELPGPTKAKYRPLHFTPDGTKLIAQNAGQMVLHVWDLRKVREQLRSLNLDWDWPAFLPDSTPKGPIRVETDLKSRDLPSAPQQKLATNISKLMQDLLAVLQPKTADDFFKRGLAFSRAGSYDLALRDYNEAIQLNPNFVQAIAARGNERFRRGEWSAAIADYEADLALDAKFVPSRFRRVCALMELGRNPAALVAITELLELNGLRVTDKHGLYLLRADIRDRLGDKAGAANDLAKASTPIPQPNTKTPLSPAAALNNFAWGLVSGFPSSQVSKAALLMMRHSIELQPDDAIHLNTLGVAEYRNGLYREAIATLEKSLTLSKGESDAFDLYFLAMCHAKLNDQPKAKEYFDQAVAWTKSRTNLRETYRAELQQFHTEATGLIKTK